MLKEKLWILNECDGANSAHAIAKIARKLSIHPIIAKLLYSRGYTDEASARNFVRMESEMLCNPFQMKDMARGIERIEKAIQRKEKIVVYGDYDVDGVTSVCTLYLYLKSKGAIIDYHIPNRAGEGYGVSRAAIEQIKENGASLIITVDTGITANAEVEYASELGIDFVITDHHECHSDLPRAVAVINPHRPDCQYPFKELAGVGVVFKFISAYEEKVCRKSRREAALKIFAEYADLVAIGTIADVMPIKSENRIIVSYGLKMIENTERPGLLALIEASSTKDGQKSDRRKKRTKITSGFVGYTLAPRINAAGRIKSAEIAVEMFLAENLDKARAISEELCQANKERQNEENKIMKEAFALLENMNVEDSRVIVLDADTWHHGVIGIVSSRLTEKYSKPSILVSFEGNDADTPSGEHIGKGSGRSIKGLNLVGALSYCEDILEKFGGHELAAGLSVRRGNVDIFRKKINEYASQCLTDEDVKIRYEADCEITPAEVTMSLVQEIDMLEPFGVSNSAPLFLVRDLEIDKIISLGAGNHSKIFFMGDENNISAVCFGVSASKLDFLRGERVDILCRLGINEFRGVKSLQFIVQDIRMSENFSSQRIVEKERYIRISGGEEFSSSEDILPTRDEIAAVYRFLRYEAGLGHTVFSYRTLKSRIDTCLDKGINYVKLRFILDVLVDIKVMSVTEISGDIFEIQICENAQKTSIESSQTFKKLMANRKG